MVGKWLGNGWDYPTYRLGLSNPIGLETASSGTKNKETKNCQTALKPLTVSFHPDTPKELGST